VPLGDEIPPPLREIADRIKANSARETRIVRELVTMFNAQRRGFYSKQAIRTALSTLGIRTEPDFENIWIDASLEFVPDGSGQPTDASAASAGITSTTGGAQPPTVIAAGISDPTYRIGKLPAANQGVISVAPDDEISAAVTLMMRNDFSQLPVMQGDRTVKGVLTWTSVGPVWLSDEAQKPYAIAWKPIKR
jgi:hypothetical protein